MAVISLIRNLVAVAGMLKGIEELEGSNFVLNFFFLNSLSELFFLFCFCFEFKIFANFIFIWEFVC